ncbi:PHB depolymerase family esterase [Streptomyces justiciae]|uniref:PHB depolymerase family esterase n=1 Tax=Streptomyces justiciae TaxID=2780140 RepID=A0ABU3M6Z3_9ACTN|nr:PHB depolymerase family esterase [Streptomyces justiciae]MDT7847269.1 PHB depolymerase family esterase [Streptomyces justiciae]
MKPSAVNRRTVLAGLAAATAVPALAACSGDADTTSGTDAGTTAYDTSSGHIEEATAITEVYGNGQRLTAVAVKYDQVIESSKLSLTTFEVADRTVTDVYANTAAAKAGHGTDGQYVIIELSPADDAAAVYQDGFVVGTAAAEKSAASSGQKPSGAPSQDSGSGAPQQKRSGGKGMSSGAKVVKAVAKVKQVKKVTATDGTVFAAGTAVKSSKIINLIVDDFHQGLKYKDADTGNSLQYNLYVPDGYDPADTSTKYPLVLFMHDAGTCSTNTLITLTHGLGAVVWASPESQAKNPCFVLAPQFTDESNEGSDGNTKALKTIKGLVDSLTSKYRIDTDRLYTTGQSGGAMTSIALDFTYPDLFAASFLVAGQWDDLAAVKPLAKQKIWAVVSQGDETAYPGMTGVMDTIEKQGTDVSRAVWNGQSTPAEFAPLTAKMRAKGTPVNFVALKKGTVVWPGLEESSVDNHICTWRAAYTIEGIRDWVFEQSK